MKAYYLDIGNTSLKLAFPAESGWEVLWHQRYDGNLDDFLAFMNDKAAEDSYHIYISSVRKDITQKLRDGASNLTIKVLSTSQIPGHLLNYSTVKTLGMDRFLGCLGAYHKKEKSVIVIDTGSACTVDFMDNSGVYQGGVIMPGIDIFKKSMRRYLPELPDVWPDIPDEWPGKSTQESLQWGVNGMVKVAIEKWIYKYRAIDEKAEVFITGGNSEYVQKLLMPDTEIIHRTELHFDGMNMFVDKILSRYEKRS